MILHTHTIGDLLAITSATMSESTSNVSTVALEFAGFGPDWLEYMQPVTIYHRGSIIFHGKITTVERSNNAGDVSTTATISNFFWLLCRQTLGQQIAEIKNAAQEARRAELAGQLGKEVASEAGYYSNSTWGDLVQTMALTAPGWMPEGSLADQGGSLLTVKASGKVSGRTVWAVTDKLITTASALYKLRQRAADVQYVVDYNLGTLTATAIGDMQSLTIDSRDGGLMAADGISPQYEAALTGVVIAYTSEDGFVSLYRYPDDLTMDADGVKVFSLSGGYFVRSWRTVAREYYEAASVLQWSGSVTLLQSALTRSPLGGTLNLIGPGCHPTWADMNAVVTTAEWDFLQGTVTLGLGRDFSDPEFADAESIASSGGEQTGQTGDAPDIGSTPGTSPDPIPGSSPDLPPSPPAIDSQGSEESAESSGSQPTQSGGIPETLLQELEDLKAQVEEQGKAIEELKKKECSCNITLSDIEAAITSQLNSLTWTLSTTGLLEQNPNGNLTINTSGGGTLGGGTINTNVSY